jgi:peptide/nickel transport system permease protein
LFPSYGLGDSTFLDRAWHFALPVFCFVYPGVAFVARQMRGGILGELQQDYVRTARAKGLNADKVVWHHAFRNSLLPIITIIANVFPLMVGGSVVLEYIFNIPGMGLLGYEAILSRDYPVVYTVMMFGAFMTLAGYLISDILYALADPRITYQKQKA